MADRIEIPFDARLNETLNTLGDPGLLLVSQGKSGKPNAMAIGWACFGRIWSMPMCVVFVRPSRYTHQLLEENGDFTVNVMPDGMTDAVIHCGTVSGRDEDKFAEMKLTAVQGLQSSAPIIGESTIAYECRTLTTNEFIPDRVAPEVVRSAYPNGDFHRVHYGKILSVRADAGIATEGR